MAHQVQSMAYVGDTPWHGLGHRLSPKQPIAIWQRQAGMDWSIRETDVLFSISGNEGLHLKAKPDHKVRAGPRNLDRLISVSLAQPKVA